MILNRLTSQEHQEEWLRIRKSYLTGTDAGAVCGMNPYKSAMQVYMDKTCTEIEITDNEPCLIQALESHDPVLCGGLSSSCIPPRHF